MGVVQTSRRVVLTVLGVVMIALAAINITVGVPAQVAAPGCEYAEGHIEWVAFFTEGPCSGKITTDVEYPHASKDDIVVILFGTIFILVAIGDSRFLARMNLKIKRTFQKSEMSTSSDGETKIHEFGEPPRSVELDQDLQQTSDFDPAMKAPRRKRDKQSAESASSDGDGFDNPFDF